MPYGPIFAIKSTLASLFATLFTVLVMVFSFVNGMLGYLGNRMPFNKLFETLFYKHKAELVQYVKQRVEHIADDVVQESFLQLIRHPEPNSIVNHRAYLYAITNNVLNAYYRKQAIFDHYHEVYEAVDAVPSQALSLELALHHQQQLKQCLQALNDLPAIQRTVFFLHRIDGMTYPEIARLLGISKATAERHFVAAMEVCVATALSRHNRPPFVG
jgi:RNA polymerase sigma-70 factor (ECF subfamily)